MDYNILELVNEVVYLESMLSKDGKRRMDAERRIAVGYCYIMNGALGALLRRQNVLLT